MAGSDAVRATAIARREVRASLERMEYHLARGKKGLKGVKREVNFLDALHRQNARLGGVAVGQSTRVGARRSFGNDALRALRGQNKSQIGRVKSSVLADFSADGLEAPRSIAGRLDVWIWVANASACPTCLSKHGDLRRGVFVPAHPSCLCIPEVPTDKVRKLSQREIVNMSRQFGNPRYKSLIDDLAQGKKTVQQVAGVENVNATAAGRAAVQHHANQGIVRQNALGTAPAPAPPAGVIDDAAKVAKKADGEPQIGDFGKFKNQADFNDAYKKAAADSWEDGQAVISEWAAQERKYHAALADARKNKQIIEATRMKLGTNPPNVTRTHLTNLKGDLKMPTAKKVGPRSRLRGPKNNYGDYETYELSTAQFEKRVNTFARQVRRDLDIDDLSDEIRWTTDWDEWHSWGHSGAEAFVENGVIHMSPSMVRDLAWVDDYASGLRMLSHEIGHVSSSMGRQGMVNSGLRPIMEEAGAEIQSIFHSRYGWSKGLLDDLSVRRMPLTDGTRVDMVGREALYWRHNYADDIEEVILQAARRNGWNRQAMLDDILDTYRNADDFEDFFRDELGNTVRIHAGKFRSGRNQIDDVAKVRHEKVWSEAPDEVRSVYSKIDEVHDYHGDFTGTARTVAEEVAEQKRVADLVRWLVEDGTDDTAAKLGSRAAQKADEIARKADDLAKKAAQKLDDAARLKADEIARLEALVDDTPVEPIRVFSKHAEIEGRPTKAIRKTLDEAEQHMADAVGPQHHDLFQEAAERVNRVRVTNSKGKRKGTGNLGLWEEKNIAKPRNKPREVVERRMTLEMNRNDFTAHNKWVIEYNEYHNRISNHKLVSYSDDFERATKTSPRKGKVITTDNPEYVPGRNAQYDEMQAWIKRNPEPASTYVATSEELSQTYLHELSHALDYGSGKTANVRTHRGRLVNTNLQSDCLDDGIPKLCDDIWRGKNGHEADPSFWYAAEGEYKGKVAETIAEITRMYFYGDRTGKAYLSTNPLGRTAIEWRQAYPELAEWVESNILTRTGTLKQGGWAS